MAGGLQLVPCSQYSPPGAEPNDRPAEQLDANAECGVLTVPENPAEPRGRSISLNIVRLPALAANPSPDPLVVFSGGPGQAATDLAKTVPPLFRRINEARDVLLIDQRGTGRSNPLNCEGESAPLTLTPEESFAEAQRQMAECLAGFDADLRFYTTPYAVDDVNRVREALGYDRVNLWGISYGTRAALEYLRRHQETVRTVTLDGSAPPAISLPHFATEDADAALERLFSLCDEQASCRARFGNLRATTRRLISELNREPQSVRLNHPLSQQPTDILLTGALVASTLRLALYVREWSPIVPLLIDQAAKGDYQPLLTLMLQAEELGEGVSLGLQQTILCAEDVLPRRERPLPDLRDSLLQLELVEQARALCANWPVGMLPANYFEPVQSDVPALVLSGALDPVTPPRWGEEVARYLPNSLHIIVPGAHHGSSLGGCVSEIVDQFIERGSHQGLETDCVDKVKPRPLFVSPAGPDMDAATQSIEKSEATGTSGVSND